MNRQRKPLQRASSPDGSAAPANLEVSNDATPEAPLLELPEAAEKGHADAPSLEGTVTLNRATLSWLGVFVKNYEETADSFPNRIWRETGHVRSEMSGNAWLEQVHPADRAAARAHAEALLAGENRRVGARYRIRDKNGRWRWIMSNGMVEGRTADGTVARYVGLDIDITEIHELQQQLEEARSLAEERAIEAEALRTVGAVIASSLDKRAAIKQMVDQVRSLLEIDEALVFERDGRQVVVNDDQTERDMFVSGFGRDALIEVMRRRTPDVLREPMRANRFWLLVPLVVRGEVLGVFAVRRTDSAEFSGRTTRLTMAVGDYLAVALNNARLYERVRTLADTDTLTRLLTRRAFFLESEGALAETAGNRGVVSSLILDIDHFKRINDECGHQVGDRVIEVVAEAFRTGLRSEDVIGRYGGEEFCAILPGVPIHEAQRVGERICAEIRELEDQPAPWPVTVSIGISTCNPAEESEPTHRVLDRLIGEADEALYSAKRNGRNRVELFL